MAYKIAKYYIKTIFSRIHQLATIHGYMRRELKERLRWMMPLSSKTMTNITQYISPLQSTLYLIWNVLFSVHVKRMLLDFI